MIFAVLVGALILLRIGLFLYFIMIEGQYMSDDSPMYIALANNLLEHQVFSTSIQPPFEYDVFRTPGFPAFLALLAYLGMESFYWVSFWQEIIYCSCIWFFYRYSLSLFDEKIVKAGVIFLLIESGGFAYPKLILSEILFLPFFMASLLLIGHYLKKLDWRYLALSGFIMGLGTLVRPALLYFPIVICLTLIAFDFSSKQRWLHSGLLLLIIAVTVSPWLIRNQQHFGKLFISGQQSNMFANYHVPIMWESAKGIPFWEGQKIIAHQVDSAIKQQEKQQGKALTLIETYKVQQAIAFKELVQYPEDYAKQWLFGILKTMMGMNLTELYQTIYVQPNRVHFFDIQELNFFNKVFKFLKAQDKFVLLAVILRGMIAVFALLGALAIIARKDCFLWIMMLANFYFICIPGPMGYSRFRFPVEVFWFIQAYFGFIWLMSYWHKPTQQ